MPIYEYQCAACGQVVERWQKFSDAPLTVCPNCGGSLHKVISACAFHLKGGGWYVSDYGGSSRPNSSTQEKPQEGGESAGDGEKPEAAATSKIT